jgi:hypothetical protein
VNSIYAGIDAELDLSVRIVDLAGTILNETQFQISAMGADSVAEVAFVDMDQLRSYAATSGGVVLLRLDLGGSNSTLSKPNTYWVSNSSDVVDWSQCAFYICNISIGSNFRGLDALTPLAGRLEADVKSSGPCIDEGGDINGRYLVDSWCYDIVLLNTAVDAIAFFIHTRLVDLGSELDDRVVYWSDNFLTLLPGESRFLTAASPEQFLFPEVRTQAYNDVPKLTTPQELSKATELHTETKAREG